MKKLLGLICLGSFTSISLLCAMPAHAKDKQPCDAHLIAKALGDELGIDLAKNGEGGDVIDLACKPHPLHPGQTIMAMLYDLKDTQGNEMLGEGGYFSLKGFILAVIDARSTKVHSTYRDTIAEEPHLRISEGALWIDTGRYNLAPGVRAFGVRMNIGHFIRGTEGYDTNYLLLVVEEGAQLRPVLKDMPMRSWGIAEGTDEGCGTGMKDTTTETRELTLSIAPTVTNGWHDLEVEELHHIEITKGDSCDTVQQPPTKKVRGVLKASEKTYSKDIHVWLLSHP
jgi:hypothetical protein